ncbi:UNVERIFIED_CONTAM: hypothetical protein PYX00_003928 [Menopon gallinae]|uniref:Uncharacterized protein n=1 Tax=Menopon gallinae TaxID=328185 RepID=A0AAW2I3V0_9NEOP
MGVREPAVQQSKNFPTDSSRYGGRTMTSETRDAVVRSQKSASQPSQRVPQHPRTREGQQLKMNSRDISSMLRERFFRGSTSPSDANGLSDQSGRGEGGVSKGSRKASEAGKKGLKKVKRESLVP